MFTLPPYIKELLHESTKFSPTQLSEVLASLATDVDDEYLEQKIERVLDARPPLHALRFNEAIKCWIETEATNASVIYGILLRKFKQFAHVAVVEEFDEPRQFVEPLVEEHEAIVPCNVYEDIKRNVSIDIKQIFEDSLTPINPDNFEQEYKVHI